MPLASNLQAQKYSYQLQTREGFWRWTTAMIVGGPTPRYEVRDIATPFGLLRDMVPLPGSVIQAMAQSITEIMQAFAPSILVSPLTLTFTVDEGRGVSDGLAVQVTNVGVYGSLLVPSITSAADYLATTPAQLVGLPFNASGVVQVTVDSTELLASGSPYTTTLSIADPTAGNTPQTVAVTVVVRSKATIVLSPTTLTFSVTKPLSGSFPPIASQTFSIANTGMPDSVLAYLVQKLTGCGTWISSITPFSGNVIGGQSQTVTVTVTPDDTMPTGVYTETLRVSGYSTNFHQDVVVQLNIS